jgi:hypothetical protein
MRLSRLRRRKVISRAFRSAALVSPEGLTCGLDSEMVKKGIEFAYSTLDLIDSKLNETGLSRLSGLVELANLSTIIGNLIAEGIVKSSRGHFTRAGAHKYQDLRSTKSEANHVEIKVALEKNKPKAHLSKIGHYLTFRYILSDERGSPFKGKNSRGDVAWIWEVRFGYLEKRHFNESNTAGDSGKTAVVNGEGMEALQVIYEDQELMPTKNFKNPPANTAI